MNKASNNPTKNEPLFATATSGVKWTFLANIGRQVISFASVAVLARLIGPSSFGLVSLATIWVAFLELFVNQGLSMAIVQRREIDSLLLSTAFWTSMGFSIALALLSVLFAPIFGAWMNEPGIVPVIRCLSFTFPLTALSGVQAALLNRSLNFRALALRTLISTIASGTIGITAALCGMGVWALVAQQLVSSLVQVIVLWRTSTWRPNFGFSPRYLRELYSFSISILISNILAFIYGRFDQMVIGKLLGAKQLGLYSMAKRLPILLGDTIVNPITSVAVPVFSRIQDQPERSSAATDNAQRILSTAAYPIFALLSVMSAPVIRLVFGEAWLSAAPVFAVSAAERFIGITSALSYPILMAAGFPKICLSLQMLSTVGSIIAVLVGYRWGALGIAFAMLINCTIVTSASITSLSIKIPWFRTYAFIKNNLSPLASSIILALTVLITQRLLAQTPLPYYFAAVIESIIGIAAYSIALWIISPSHITAVIAALQKSLFSRFTKSSAS